MLPPEHVAVSGPGAHRRPRPLHLEHATASGPGACRRPRLLRPEHAIDLNRFADAPAGKIRGPVP
jgi:hypothetical protein